MFGWTEIELEDATQLKNLILTKSLKNKEPHAEIFGAAFSKDLAQELSLKFEKGFQEQITQKNEQIKHIFVFSKPKFRVHSTQRGIIIDLIINYSFGQIEANHTATLKLGSLEYHGIIPFKEL